MSAFWPAVSILIRRIRPVKTSAEMTAKYVPDKRPRVRGQRKNSTFSG
jgi:hypothetical protein